MSHRSRSEWVVIFQNALQRAFASAENEETASEKFQNLLMGFSESYDENGCPIQQGPDLLSELFRQADEDPSLFLFIASLTREEVRQLTEVLTFEGEFFSYTKDPLSFLEVLLRRIKNEAIQIRTVDPPTWLITDFCFSSYTSTRGVRDIRMMELALSFFNSTEEKKSFIESLLQNHPREFSKERNDQNKVHIREDLEALKEEYKNDPVQIYQDVEIEEIVNGHQQWIDYIEGLKRDYLDWNSSKEEELSERILGLEQQCDPIQIEQLLGLLDADSLRRLETRLGISEEGDDEEEDVDEDEEDEEAGEQ